jgi:hypothetical protein
MLGVDELPRRLEVDVRQDDDEYPYVREELPGQAEEDEEEFEIPSDAELLAEIGEPVQGALIDDLISFDAVETETSNFEEIEVKSPIWNVNCTSRCESPLENPRWLEDLLGINEGRSGALTPETCESPTSSNISQEDVFHVADSDIVQDKPDMNPPSEQAIPVGQQMHGKTEKYRQREAHQAELKREAQQQDAFESLRKTTVIVKEIIVADHEPQFKDVKYSKDFYDTPAYLRLRHFHRWIQKITGLPKDLQNFTKFDDAETVTFRRVSERGSPEYREILGKTFRFCFPKLRKAKIVHWRLKHVRPATIPLSGNRSRPLRRHDISKHGLYHLKLKEVRKLRLRPCVVGMCSPRVHRAESPSKK